MHRVTQLLSDGKHKAAVALRLLFLPYRSGVTAVRYQASEGLNHRRCAPRHAGECR